MPDVVTLTGESLAETIDTQGQISAFLTFESESLNWLATGGTLHVVHYEFGILEPLRQGQHIRVIRKLRRQLPQTTELVLRQADQPWVVHEAFVHDLLHQLRLQMVRFSQKRQQFGQVHEHGLETVPRNAKIVIAGQLEVFPNDLFKIGRLTQ